MPEIGILESLLFNRSNVFGHGSGLLLVLAVHGRVLRPVPADRFMHLRHLRVIAQPRTKEGRVAGQKRSSDGCEVGPRFQSGTLSAVSASLRWCSGRSRVSRRRSRQSAAMSTGL